jgi:hypothetical protein
MVPVNYSVYIIVIIGALKYSKCRENNGIDDHGVDGTA